MRSFRRTWYRHRRWDILRWTRHLGLLSQTHTKTFQGVLKCVTATDTTEQAVQSTDGTEMTRLWQVIQLTRRKRQGTPMDSVLLPST